jgi:DNA polymerase I
VACSCRPSLAHRYRLTERDLEDLADGGGLLADLVLRFRTLSRNVSFLHAGACSERIHPVWRQTRTSTGRITAQNPPVQNIDRARRSRLIRAPQGYVLVKADWKACQARILAHLSQDEKLNRLFREGRDFQSETQRLLGLGSRNDAKPINFGLVFGQGPVALARAVNESWEQQGKSERIGEQRAKQFIDAFFAEYSGIGPYFEREYAKMIKIKKQDRLLKNPISGRIRRFDRRASPRLQREFRATLLQQVESHILKLSLISLDAEIGRRGLSARIVATIHDSIWVEAPVEETAQVRSLMEQVMVSALSLSVPLEVDLE